MWGLTFPVALACWMALRRMAICTSLSLKRSSTQTLRRSTGAIGWGFDPHLSLMPICYVNIHIMIMKAYRRQKLADISNTAAAH